MSAAVEVDAGPFEFEGGGSASVLCLHGFTGTPYEMRVLGEACAQRGLRAVGPVLPGHGGSAQALAEVSHREWLEAARRHAGALHRPGQRLFAVGLSMGGLLSLALAAEGALDALVVVATPLRLRPMTRHLVPVAKYLRPLVRKHGGSDIRDDAARLRHPSLDVMPLRAVHELMRLQRFVRTRLARVRVPILVAHGRLDRTANPADARTILASVRSPQRELLFLERSGHVVPVDHDGPELAKATAEFLARHL